MSQSLPPDARAREHTRYERGVLTGDVLTGAGLATALRGVEVAYYLIHSMERSSSHEDVSPFPERERARRENFAAAAAAAGVRRIVYLGGPTLAWTAAGGGPERTPHHTSPAARRSSASCARPSPTRSRCAPRS